MHPYKRSVRVADLLKEEIADIILHKLKDPRVGFITVTHVKVTDDLKFARVYVTVFDKAQEDTTIAVLNAAKGFFRTELSKRVRMKVLPRLEFFKDESMEYGLKIDELLRKIKEEE
ncbi:MAG: 30S ribosome-binding factor RbfA [Nitrospirae bacterium]|nr:MAG: 30S ribosome-binding factor RbfA [Nitrospirota bacterium]